MDSGEAKVAASVIQVVRVYISAYGKDFPALLDDVGLSRDLLEDHIGMVPLAPVIALFERAGDVLDDPCFGLHLSGSVRPGGSGLLGRLAISAPTVRAALQAMEMYGQIFVTKVFASFEEKDGLAYAQWAVPSEVAAPRLQYSSFVSAIIVRRLAEAIGGDWQPLRCEFAHRAFDCREDAARLFGRRLEFDRSANLFVFEQSRLDCPMPYADSMVFADSEDLARRRLSDLSTERLPDVVIAVREHILEVLSSGEVERQIDLNSVANSVGVTTRVLQRRLEQANTSFENVLMETRSGLAEQLLKDTDRSITEIAFDLGYSDPSVFTRAARRWFDMSPKDFRQQHRSGSGRA